MDIRTMPPLLLVLLKPPTACLLRPKPTQLLACNIIIPKLDHTVRAVPMEALSLRRPGLISIHPHSKARSSSSNSIVDAQTLVIWILSPQPLLELQTWAAISRVSGETHSLRSFDEMMRTESGSEDTRPALRRPLRTLNSNTCNNKPNVCRTRGAHEHTTGRLEVVIAHSLA